MTEGVICHMTCDKKNKKKFESGYHLLSSTQPHTNCQLCNPVSFIYLLLF